jgi:hypothetical protein
MTDQSARYAPFRLDLEQQKKRAKELCTALRAAEPAAIARFRDKHPKVGEQNFPELVRDFGKLADAQLVIARELRMPSWPRLKAHIEEMERASVDRSTLDDDLPTLHIRCGSDIKDRLREAGFHGDFVEIGYPFGFGPATADPARDEERAQFMLDHAVKGKSVPLQEILDWIRAGETGLIAAKDVPRVVIWLEHDSFDQLVLLRCLAQFAAGGMPARLDLISVDRFPGKDRFIGLGQLPPEALRLLWSERRALTPADVALGSGAWTALVSPDPRSLAAIMKTGTPALPHLAPALHRHLQELPSTRSGLSLSQSCALQSLTSGPLLIGRMYEEVMSRLDPLPWLADTYFGSIVEELEKSAEPIVECVGHSPRLAAGHWANRILRLTEGGRAVLAGKLDWLSLTRSERWVGGVMIRPGERNWRWDAARQEPVFV